MRILYLSVHAILEYDEITLLRSLGHSVFPIGAYFAYKTSQSFRPQIVPTSDEMSLLESFTSTGCSYSGGSIYELDLKEAFVRKFDAIIVMDSVGVVMHHWNTISIKPVFLRTIGQSILETEPSIKNSRKMGLRVIRYSPAERRAHNYGGEDTLIRFYKPAPVSRPWSGDRRQTLTFANHFAGRYARENEIYSSIFAEPDRVGVLAGAGNDGIPGGIGMVSFEDQQTLLAESRAYFYCTGMKIPYTLNFIEAWIAGAPVVVLCADPGLFFEIPNLINHDVDGYVAHTADEAIRYIDYLMVDQAKAAHMSLAGKARAESLFSAAVIAPQWQALLASL